MAPLPETGDRHELPDSPIARMPSVVPQLIAHALYDRARRRAPAALRGRSTRRRHASLVAAHDGPLRRLHAGPQRGVTRLRARGAACRAMARGGRHAAARRSRIVVPAGAHGGGRHHGRAPRCRGRPLRFLHDFTLRAQGAPATLAGRLAYRGYCGADALGDVRGKLVICHATRRSGLPSDEQRRTALQPAAALSATRYARRANRRRARVSEYRAPPRARGSQAGAVPP